MAHTQKHCYKIDGFKLKEYIKVSGSTQHAFGKKIGLTWNKFKPYLSKVGGMPIVLVDKVVKELNLDYDDLLADDDARADFDLKNEMIASLVRIRYAIDMGISTEMDFAQAVKTYAPYLVSKVFASGGFDAVAFATALEAAKAAVARGEKPEDLSEVERQQLSL